MFGGVSLACRAPLSHACGPTTFWVRRIEWLQSRLLFCCRHSWRLTSSFCSQLSEPCTCGTRCDAAPRARLGYRIWLTPPPPPPPPGERLVPHLILLPWSQPSRDTLPLAVWLPCGHHHVRHDGPADGVGQVLDLCPRHSPGNAAGREPRNHAQS